MKDLKYNEIRSSYLDFFKKKGHAEIPSAPLVPENDPSVLFVNAGMFPLVPFLMGEKHPKGTRLTNSQRCVRTGDIDEVGNNFHCTSFEMLGNWSLNDYFKEDALRYTLEFFVEELELDINNIYASVFGGEDNIPEDEVSISTWKNLFKEYGIDAKVGKRERIQKFGKKENWWGLDSGGPCGPDSEIFYDTGKEPCGEDCNVSCNCGKYIEIGNNVFMEYLKEGENLKPLGRHNVDFGGGLERITALIQRTDSVYEIDIYKPILEKIKEITERYTNRNANPEDTLRSQRIIVDHIKAATWIIMDGVIPSSNQQGYILRRLIRRAVRHARKLNITDTFTKEVAEVAIDQFSPIYQELNEKREYIIKIIEEEEIKFNNTLENGLKELDRLLEQKGIITGENAFKLYETYGLPLEVTEEILGEKNVTLANRQSFYSAQKDHQEKSRSASKGLFKGGLADTSEISVRYHTATHLLLASLRKVLGEHIYQKGSNITPERLRLDFPNKTKLTTEELKQVEDLVNSAIDQELDVTFEEHPKKEALEIIEKHSSTSSFEEKYPDIVKVYYVGDKEAPFSVELCNGPHVSNTRELGKFKIVKQENIGAGVKRIKAILE
ncbi:MAG: Alanine--tRNA ligase [candidate division WS6 bacterium 36_33]|uniref:alanine--tRNA ligase n=1 Tax=candidate division WS6 bacterium 36_33 TaxID=1641388 RepID=A0A101GZW6_9BACT|nr:MAG: Alanine--tRNA ligase [candidate division WS6 bacterium 36_33]